MLIDCPYIYTHVFLSAKIPSHIAVTKHQVLLTHLSIWWQQYTNLFFSIYNLCTQPLFLSWKMLHEISRHNHEYVLLRKSHNNQRIGDPLHWSWYTGPCNGCKTSAVCQRYRRSPEHTRCSAVQEQFHLNIQVDSISQCGPDYLLVVDSLATKSLMLTRGFLKVSTFTLTPWTADYGSTNVPLHTQLPVTHRVRNHSAVQPWNEHLTIDVSGIPPHLCCESIVRHLLTSSAESAPYTK